MAKEIIIKKCYTCTYFEWYQVDNNYYPDAYSEDEYAETSSKARYRFFLGLENDNKELFLAIRVRRCKERDWLRRDPHPALSTLSPEQIQKMKHAVGIQNDVADHLSFYRNRYVVPFDSDFDDLVNKGFALKSVTDSGLEYYYLTKEGQNVMISLIPIKRYHKQLLCDEKIKKTA